MADTSRYFGIGLDTTQLKKQAEEARKAFSRIGDEAMKQAKVMDQAFSGQIIPPAFEKDIQRLSKLSIDAFGSISDTARKAITEMQEDILSLSNLEKMMQQLNKSYEDGEIATKDYLNAQARLTVLHEQITASIRQQEQALKQDTAQMEIAGDSITSMQAKVALLTTEYMKLSEAQRNGLQGEGILKQMSDLQSKLDAAQASMNKFGMAGRTQFNMLGMSMQQLVRELPSLAMGPQMFFLAISNNLPIFTDALAQARKEYQLLTAAGKTAIPVWKQVMKSLLSWQTALSALPAILIMFGPQIAEFFQSFFTGKEKIDSATDALRNIHKELESNNANYGENVVALKSLTDEWGRLSDEASKTKWIKENKSEFDKLGIFINDVSDAETAFVDNTDDIIEAFKLRAQAAAAQELAEEKYREAMIKRNEAELEAAKGPSRGDRILSMTSTVTGPGISGYQAVGQKVNEKEFFDERVQGLEDEAQAAEDAGDAYFKLYEAKRLESGQMLEGLGLGDQGDDKKQIEETKDYLSQLLELRRDNEDRQIDLMKDGTEKELAEIDLRYKRMRDKVKELEAGLTAQQGGQLTPEQQILFADAYLGIDAQQQRDMEDVTKARLDAEAAAMRDYLQEYGTFQQRKLAIAQEYADKIAKAQTEGDRLTLEKERDQKLSGMEAESLRMSIDWPSVFGEFGGMFDEVIRPELEKVKQYMQTDDFKNLQPTDQSAIIEAVNRLEQSLGGAGRVSFKQLGKEVDALRKSMLALNDAKQQEAEALERLAEAQEAYENALKNGTDKDIAAADLRLTSAKTEADTASENVRKAEETAQQNQKTTTETANNLNTNMRNVTEGLQKLASGGLKNALDGFAQLSKSGIFGDKMTKVADSLEDVPIVGWILSIIDILKDGLSDLVGGLLDGIFNAVSGILSDVLSGDLFVTLGSSIMKGVGNIFDAITFGGFSHWGNNAAETKATIDRLTTRNEALIDSIDRLNETMKEARGAETVKATEEAIELQQKVNENYRDIAAARAHYQGKHHSWSKYFNDWLDGVMGNPNFNTGHNDWEVYQRMNEIAGFQIKSRTDFLSITPEQMAEMLADADIKQLLVDIGEGGYGAKMVATLEDFAEQAGKIEELEEQMYESLTQISFDSLYDSFIDTLMDMDASAEDFSKNFSEYMMKALLANKVGEMMYDDMEAWYKRFGESMKDGELSDDEMASLREEWDKLVSEGLAMRDDLAAATGYDQTGSEQQQQASAGYSISMSQDTGDAILGRATAMYECELRIADKIDIGNVNLEAVKNHVAETRDIIQSCYGELVQISENTGAIIKPIQQIQKDIAEVKNNTSRL